MIDTEKPTDSMDNKPVAVDEPPPYSRRQASTSSTNNRSRLRSPNNPANRFVAPPPTAGAPPFPSPRLVISPANQHASPPSDPRAASLVDLVYDKPASPKDGMGYTDMGAFGGLGTPYSAGPSAAGSNFSVPSTSTAGAMGIPPRSPTVGTRKNTETVILMGTGSSGQWLNHIVVATKSEPIQGAYHIDPNLDVQDHATARRAGISSKKAHSRSTSSLSATSKSGKKKADYSWHPTAEPEPCNAFFESKTSNVDVLLSVGGQGSTRSSKANVDIRSKNGKITVKVVDIVEGRRLNLDVATVKGDIEIFLPRSFSGPLHVHTEGDITLLPRLAATMEVISAREDDALVMVTSPRPSPSVSPAPSSSHQSHKPVTPGGGGGGFSSWLHPNGGGLKAQSYEGDFANLVSSSGGNILVGFVGEDKGKEENQGVWKKIVSLFTGERSNTS